MVKPTRASRARAVDSDDQTYLTLTPRERSVLDAVEQLGEADAGQVTALLAGDATHEAVRAALRALEKKGELTHEAVARRYVYRLAPPPPQAQASVLRRLVRRFFDGSPARAAAALLQSHDEALEVAELDRLAAEVEAARKRAGRRR
jgi:BlaI family transcriptional regulator, penicillinase repressor